MIINLAEKKERIFFDNDEVVDGFRVFDPYMKKKGSGFGLREKFKQVIYFNRFF